MNKRNKMKGKHINIILSKISQRSHCLVLKHKKFQHSIFVLFYETSLKLCMMRGKFLVNRGDGRMYLTKYLCTFRTFFSLTIYTLSRFNNTLLPCDVHIQQHAHTFGENLGRKRNAHTHTHAHKRRFMQMFLFLLLFYDMLKYF